MKIKEIVSALERFAPLPLQDGFDNAGLILIGVGVPIRNKLIRKYRDKKQDEKKNMPE